MTTSTLRCPTVTGSEQWPDQPACVTPDGVVSYAEFGQRVSRLCRALRCRGLGNGSRVGLMLAPGPDALALYFALPRVGACACPISARLPAAEAARQLTRIGADCVIVGESTLCDVPAMSVGELVADARLAGDSEAGAEISWEQAATIVHTSGSTGDSKAVVHSCRAHYFSAKGANENLPIGPGTRWLLSLPLYHVGGIGILWRCILAGGAVVVPGRQESLAEAMARYVVTHLSLVGTQLYRLLQDEPELRGPLEAALVGGGPVPSELVQRAAERGINVVPTYGLTEMSSQVATLEPHDSIHRLDTAGQVLRYRKVRISDDGEILVKGETLYSGVATATGLDAPPLDSGGWYATGDLGRIDDEGYLTVLGRRDNLFISGGENIQPETIEAALLALRGVLDVTVVPVPDEEFGRRAVAFVECDAGIDLAGLAPELEQTLPRFMIPVAFYPYPPRDDAALKGSRDKLQQAALAIHQP